ncbi:MAG: O-antigen ligase family protein [Clostridia bacterium]|nr:O-antigen ligase family protein [Clostridia bacterium]
MATSRYINQNNQKAKSLDSKWLFPFLIAFFFGLGAAFSVGTFDYGRIFAVALAVITLLLNVNDAFCLIVFAFPFTSMLKFTVDTISILPILYLIITLKIISKNKLSIPPNSLLCVCAFAVLQALGILLYETLFFKIISILLCTCFVLFVSNYAIDNRDTTQRLLPKASLSFAMGTTLMLLLSDIFPHLPTLVHPNAASMETAKRYAATVIDPNELAQIILIAIGLLIAVMPSFKSMFAKLLAMAMIVYMGLTGIRTNSKSYAIALVALFVFLMAVYIRISAKEKGAGNTLLKLLPVLLITAIGFILMFQHIVIPIFEARSQEQAGFWTNRDTLWVRYVNALLHRFDVLLVGCGAGNVTSVIRLAGGSATGVPHNTYLEYIIQFGVIGLILLFTAWKKALASIKEKLSTYYVIALAAFLITAFGISVNDNDCLFILLALLSLPAPPETSTIK